MSDPPAFDDAQIKYLDENYGGASSQNVHWMIFNGVLVCTICLDPTTVTLVCGHAMCEECMGRLAVFQGQTLTRSRRRVVIRCPLRCHALTERVLA